MRVINVVMIKNGVVDDITSFGVFDEENSKDVVDKAEKDFLEKAEGLGFVVTDLDVETLFEDGYYVSDKSINSSVCISWSEI